MLGEWTSKFGLRKEINVQRAFFKLDSDGQLVPRARASSGWGTQHMRGMAVCGALARTVEHTVNELGRNDLRPARWTVDLFRAAGMKPTAAIATIVREGRRLCLLEAELTQDGRAVARATALYLAASESPPGQVWATTDFLDPPPFAFGLPADVDRLYQDAGGPWTLPSATHQDAQPKSIWQYPTGIVEGEPLTAFQAVASLADVANAAINFGSNGLEFVNADVNLVLGRLPEGLEIGMKPATRVEQAGISTGSTQLFDRQGTFGVVTMCALANAENAVDLLRLNNIADE